MDANAPPSYGTTASPVGPRGKQGAKPKPQTTSSPDWREPVTARGGGQGLLPPWEVKVYSHSSVQEKRTNHQHWGPGGSVSNQGTTGMSAPGLGAMVQPADQNRPVDGRTQSATSACNCTVSPEMSSTSQQTTDGPTATAAMLPPPYSSEPPLLQVNECVDKRTKCETSTSKCTKVEKVLGMIQSIPGLMAGNKNKPKKTSTTFEDGGRQFSRCQHTVPLEDHICQMRSVLDKNEEELKTARKEVNDVRGHYEDQVNRLSSALHTKDQEMRSWMERAQHNEQQHNDNVARMQNFYAQEMNNMNAALMEKRKEVEYLKHSVSEKETYIQRKMEDARSVIEQKNEELKSFKDRVAGEVALSIKTGKAESMNNPVSKTRLKEMYEELRTLWPTIKKHLNSSNKKPESVKAKLQEVFTEAMASSQQQKSQISKLYGLDEAGGEPACQKVHEYRKATIQYLQLTLYHNRKDEAQSKASSLHEGGAQEAIDFLYAQCQWLGNLMALNEPPLVPDWENHDPGMNKWDILPRNLRCSTVL